MITIVWDNLNIRRFFIQINLFNLNKWNNQSILGENKSILSSLETGSVEICQYLIVSHLSPRPTLSKDYEPLSTMTENTGLHLYLVHSQRGGCSLKVTLKWIGSFLPVTNSWTKRGLQNKDRSFIRTMHFVSLQKEMKLEWNPYLFGTKRVYPISLYFSLSTRITKGVLYLNQCYKNRKTKKNQCYNNLTKKLRKSTTLLNYFFSNDTLRFRVNGLWLKENSVPYPFHF